MFFPLAPLYLLGAVAIVGPIILHLIRRHTKEQTTFSSLMFLSESTPRMQQRSRVENWFLLILRCLAVCLLALIFARPYWSGPVSADATQPGSRVVVLIDRSASMRREDLWQQALDKAYDILGDAQADDLTAVYTFDTDTTTVLTFEQSKELTPAARTEVVRKELKETEPSWAATHTGGALVSAVGAILEEDDEQDQLGNVRRVVLISDMQEGARLKALETFSWPETIKLDIETLAPKKPTNASLQLVSQSAEERQAADKLKKPRRVRVTNAADSTNEEFEIHWAGDEEKVTAYVAPGKSQIVAVPDNPAGAKGNELVLGGDAHEFDNTLHVAPPVARRVEVLYLGDDDGTATSGLAYYLQRVFLKTPTIDPRVTIRSSSKSDSLAGIPLGEVDLLIVAGDVNESLRQPLRKYLTRGGQCLFLLRDLAAGTTLAALLGEESLSVEAGKVDEYAMLGELDLEHSLLSDFADPRFNDFTKIHFWNYRKLKLKQLPNARVIASFDNGDPAWLTIPIDKGRMLVMTSGWQPSDSEFARSASKFIPFMYSLLRQSGADLEAPSQFFVHDDVPLPKITSLASADTEATKVSIVRPDDEKASLEADATIFKNADLPGLYQFATNDEKLPFAVNVAPAEGRTDPLERERLEQLGVVLKASVVEQAASEAALRHLQFVELESRQKLWRWVLVAVLLLLLLETAVAGYLASAPVRTGAST